MKKLFIPILSVSLFLLGGCRNDTIPTPEKPDASISFSQDEVNLFAELSSNTTKIPEQEAMAMALDAADILASSPTKTGSSRTIKSSQAVTMTNISRSGNKVGVKSSDSKELTDTVAYIINFDNDEGYAIVAADKRIPDKILACISEGGMGNVTDNPGMALFLEYAERYIVESIEKAEASRDSIAKEIMHKLLVSQPELGSTLAKAQDEISSEALSKLLAFDITMNEKTGEWEREAIVPPLSVVEWNQGNTYSTLYNKYTRPKGCGGKAPYTGCVAVAAAQIMAYWKYPSAIDGYAMNWDEMVRYTDNFMRNNYFNKRWSGSMRQAPMEVSDNVARLMERIGEHIGMRYDCDGSGATMSSVVYWLKSIGFRGGVIGEYGFERVKHSLDKNRIVLASGSKDLKKFSIFGITIFTTIASGHAWNFDGYIQEKRSMELELIIKDRATQKVINQATDVKYDRRNFVHINWGWGGNGNGYYASGVLDPSQHPEYSSGTKGSNYQYKLEVYTHFRL